MLVHTPSRSVKSPHIASNIDATVSLELRQGSKYDTALRMASSAALRAALADATFSMHSDLIGAMKDYTRAGRHGE